MVQSPSDVKLLDAELESARQQIRSLETRLERQQWIHRSLSQDHRFHEAALERVADGVCVCQETSAPPFLKFTVWNRRMTEMTGYTMEEINRVGWYQALYPDPEIRERARERMAYVTRGKDRSIERWEIVRADGAMRPVSMSMSVLTAADGSLHVLGLMHDLTEEEELKRQASLAKIDLLTSLRNRRGFEEDAGLLFKLARRQGQCISLGFLDIARFKVLNDEHGHQEGDRALQATAEMLLKSVRSSDVVGRIGGDEFAIVLPATEASGAETAFSDLENRLLEVVQERGWDIGFDMGVATFTGDIPEMEDALRSADKLMYLAKRSTESHVVYGQFIDR